MENLKNVTFNVRKKNNVVEKSCEHFFPKEPRKNNQ